MLSGYLGLVTISALTRPGQADGAPSASTRRFVILVPAHNEEAGITRALRSFDVLDYPTELFGVHVVADNCTDATAAVVRSAGYECHDRSGSAQPGKGPALNWLLDRLIDRGVLFDSVVIVDADTSLDPEFLRHIAAAMDAGATVAQGFYGVRDVAGSSSSALRYAALACRHHLRPLGRTRLGGSSGLYGNGMAFDRDLMSGRRWSGHLTEDMEFQMDLVLDGRRVAYVPGARLEAEMPGSLETSTSQNERWELGRIQVARTYLPRFLDRLRQGANPGRAADLDAIFDLLVPPLSVLVIADAAVTLGSVAACVLRGRPIDKVNLAISGAASVALVVHVFGGLRSVRAPRIVYRSLLQAPQMIAWKTLLYLRVLRKPEEVTWQRTTRDSSR